MHDTTLAHPDSPLARRPAAVTIAFVALVAAVGCGITEAAVRGALLGDAADIGELTGGWLLRAGIYLAVLGVAWRMLRGERWARNLLAAGIGVVGTASLVVEPVRMLANGGAGVFADMSAATVFLALTRAGHLCAVFVAIPAMYTRGARAWFRAGHGAGRPW
ncbi:hypothetical protein [Nocardia grenadensis]|uniref:hypothetical protein n=1 Tax=Nocardia grenadensis TaxID=931537 RepID=UPI0007A4E9AE|nr:hypothetical protein [Nocardia grenadensis]